MPHLFICLRLTSHCLQNFYFFHYTVPLYLFWPEEFSTRKFYDIIGHELRFLVWRDLTFVNKNNKHFIDFSFLFRAQQNCESRGIIYRCAYYALKNVNRARICVRYVSKNVQRLHHSRSLRFFVLYFIMQQYPATKLRASILVAQMKVEQRDAAFPFFLSHNASTQFNGFY